MKANKKLQDLRFELAQMAEREAYRLYRLARKAKKHGTSTELVHSIQEEASYCLVTLTTYPDRLLSWDFEYKMKYAFKF